MTKAVLAIAAAAAIADSQPRYQSIFRRSGNRFAVENAIKQGIWSASPVRLNRDAL